MRLRMSYHHTTDTGMGLHGTTLRKTYSYLLKMQNII